MSPLSHFHYIPDGAITFLYESLIMSPLSIQNSIPERAISHMSGTELRIVSSRENEWKRLYSSAPRPQAPTVHQLSFRSCASGKADAFSRQNNGHCVQQTWFGRASYQSQRDSQMAVVIQGENNRSLLAWWLTELVRLSSWRWKMEAIYLLKKGLRPWGFNKPYFWKLRQRNGNEKVR